MCTAVGQVSVFNVSTIPRIGLMARFAIPVLKFREVMSRIAVPVVSDPVPAVVGTVRMVSWRLAGLDDRRTLTCDQWPKFLGDR